MKVAVCLTSAIKGDFPKAELTSICRKINMRLLFYHKIQSSYGMVLLLLMLDWSQEIAMITIDFQQFWTASHPKKIIW